MKKGDTEAERNRTRGEGVMEGNRKDKEIEKGGHRETTKKDVGGRAGDGGEGGERDKSEKKKYRKSFKM